ncbi:c-type cytochrome [Thioclava sp. GXIMD4215]|uniref:c-type cytochrome n=1 Tax=Thioclava sp. GXIMD4215 TaxID=3131928 RepID=UPI00311B25A8
MKKTFIGALGALAVVGAGAFFAITILPQTRSYPLTQTPAEGEALAAKVARGEYIARASDCVACHTAPEGGAPFAGGYRMDTPFGAILSSNITSDPETGIGNWTEERFNAAVRHGIGRHGFLYPAMPYTAYAKMTDADIDDLWAYMQTVPAVQNAVVENQLPFPYNQRWLLSGWNLLFFHADVFAPDQAQSEQINRGAYLVEGPGHCAACHTAKNALGGDGPAALAGGTLGGWHAPDLTGNPHTGLGRWSAQDIATYLKTGANDHSVSSGPMTEAIENSTQYLTDEDLAAIAAYLKALPAKGPQPPAALASDDPVMVLGAKVYSAQCEACHVPSGSGIPNMIPALLGNAALNAEDPVNLIRTVLTGAPGVMTHENQTAAGMPRFDWKMPDDNIAAVLTYLRNAGGNAAAPVTPQMVAKARQDLGAGPWIGAAH